jgi:hypothetical protein
MSIECAVMSFQCSQVSIEDSRAGFQASSPRFSENPNKTQDYANFMGVGLSMSNDI